MTGAGGFEAHDEQDGHEGTGAREGSGDHEVFPEDTEKMSDGLGNGDDGIHGAGEAHEGGPGADERGNDDPNNRGTEGIGDPSPWAPADRATPAPVEPTATATRPAPAPEARPAWATAVPTTP